MVKHLNIRVAGRVQGVFFRASAASKAESLGLSGFVRNEPDGSVYIEAEGDEKRLEELLNWCKAGGPPAAVVHFCKAEESPMKHYIGFSIHR